MFDARHPRPRRRVTAAARDAGAHAVNERSHEHVVARDWLSEALDGRDPVAFSRSVVLAFLRLSTHPAIFPRPLRLGDAAHVVESWFESPAAVTVEPTRRHLPLLRGLLLSTGTNGNLINDAHLAALALEHGAGVVSFERDFARFEGIRLHRPS